MFPRWIAIPMHISACLTKPPWSFVKLPHLRRKDKVLFPGTPKHINARGKNLILRADAMLRAMFNSCYVFLLCLILLMNNSLRCRGMAHPTSLANIRASLRRSFSYCPQHVMIHLQVSRLRLGKRARVWGEVYFLGLSEVKEHEMP